MARDTFSSNRKMYLSWEEKQIHLSQAWDRVWDEENFKVAP